MKTLPLREEVKQHLTFLSTFDVDLYKTQFDLMSILNTTGYVTKSAKRGLIHTSDFATLMSHNFVCDQAITLKRFTHIRLMIAKCSHKILKL